MPKYTITDTIAAQVHYRYQVEAETLDEAMKLWKEDSGSYLVDYEIGDSLDGYNYDIYAEEVTP